MPDCGFILRITVIFIPKWSSKSVFSRIYQELNSSDWPMWIIHSNHPKWVPRPRPTRKSYQDLIKISLGMWYKSRENIFNDFRSWNQIISNIWRYVTKLHNLQIKDLTNKLSHNHVIKIFWRHLCSQSFGHYIDVIAKKGVTVKILFI